MSNGEIQADKKSSPPKVRKSVIRKSIQRTLSTAKYESIVIHDEIEEEIEWSSLEEREKKINNWTTLLLKEFQQSHDRILDELKLSHKKAHFKNSIEDKDNRPEPGSELDDIENLDTLS